MVRRVNKFTLSVLLILSFVVSITLGNAVVNLKEGSIIRDTEIEGILHDLNAPIFGVAGLNANNLNL